MPIDVSPPMTGNLQGFQIAQPQSTDPLQTLAQMGQLRNQGLQQQQAQMQIEQGRLQMASNQAMLQAFVDGGGDPDKTTDLIMKSPNIQAPDKIGFQKHMLDLATQKVTLSKDQQALQDEENDHWAGLFKDAQDQDDVNTALSTGLQRGYKPPAGMVDANGSITQFTDPQHIQAYANGLLSLSKLDAQKLIQQQTATSAATAGESTAKAGQATAETAKTQLETQQTQAELNWLKGLTPQTLGDEVSGNIDKTKYPDLWNRAYNEAQIGIKMGKPELVRETLQKYGMLASEQEKTKALETDPDVIRARTQQQVNTEIATTPYKVAQQVAASKALRQGDNPETAGVAPAAIIGVQNQAMKLDEQYAKEKAATEALGHVIDLAQSGNKAAGSNLPLLGVETLNAVNGIKRVNSAELHQYEQAGSLWDSIVGRLGKLTVGKPIPQDVLNDIRTLHQTLGQQSYQNYTDSLNSINARTGAKLTPKIEPADINRAAGIPPKPASIPPNAITHYYPPDNTFYFSMDGGKTWRKIPAK